MEPETARILITAVASFASAALGAGVAMYVTHRQHANQRSIEDDKTHKTNMERIHQELTTIVGGVGQLQMHMIANVAWERGMTNDEVGEVRSSTSTLHMLVDFYAPSLRSHINSP
jgi:hypothetical protein